MAVHRWSHIGVHMVCTWYAYGVNMYAHVCAYMWTSYAYHMHTHKCTHRYMHMHICSDSIYTLWATMHTYGLCIQRIRFKTRAFVDMYWKGPYQLCAHMDAHIADMTSNALAAPVPIYDILVLVLLLLLWHSTDWLNDIRSLDWMTNMLEVTISGWWGWMACWRNSIS